MKFISQVTKYIYFHSFNQL